LQNGILSHEAIYAEKGRELNTSRRLFKAGRRGANKVKTNDINKNEVGNSKRRTTAIRRTKTSKWLRKGWKIRVSCCDPTSVVRNTTACVYDPYLPIVPRDEAYSSSQRRGIKRHTVNRAFIKYSRLQRSISNKTQSSSIILEVHDVMGRVNQSRTGNNGEV
jgi:hypothetical protein